MIRLAKYIVIVCLILLLSGTVSALNITSDVTDTSITYYFDPPRIQDYPELVYFNNEKIETPIDDSLKITGLTPNTEYVLVVMYESTHPLSPNEYYKHSTVTLPSEQLQLTDVVLEYGYILTILLVLLAIYMARLPFGGFIPLFMSLIGVIHYVKYEGDDKLILISYLILMIISAYTIYTTGEKQ
jgi:hypothetical protein